MFDTLDVGASGLTAERVRMDTIAGNVANIDTFRTNGPGSGPYQRRFVILQQGGADGANGPGVHVEKIGVDTTPGRKEYDPSHPFAGPDGYVRYPNVDLAVETVNMLEASRAYDADVSMMETTKSMITSSLRILA
ncbi:MAG TPA: flagellar basal body rod protein FlgC [Tepidisphaeraceae bacterium]|nr:flagellar basal body rod protein FlgC [Tepidisphaeraceae bacterium]